MIRLLLLRLRRRWLLHAIASARQTMANAVHSEQVFESELREVDAEIAAERAGRRMQRYRVVP